MRLTKTRSAAQTLAVSGRLRCNGRAIDRAHHAVKIGDVVTFFAANRVRIVRVETLPTRRGPAPEAQACYQELTIANVSQEDAAD